MTGRLATMGLLATLAGGAADAADIAFERARAVATRAALARVGPSVVMIETIGGVQPGIAATTRPFGRQTGAGFRVADGPSTGVVWSEDGLIVTSSFNLVREPSVITVVTADGERHSARLLARDFIRRLALIQVTAKGLRPPEWTRPAERAVGQFALAVGRGLGGQAPSVSVGMVSAIGRHGGHAVQTDAKLSPANYGGPLIDMEGRVLGICVPLAGAGPELAGVEWYDSGIGFAVPRERVEQSISRLSAGEDIESGKIGVALGTAPPDQAGADDGEEELILRPMITAIASPSPAATAGLQPGDIIAALDGAAIADFGELQRRLADLESGTEIVLRIVRDGDEIEKRLTLARAGDIGGFVREESTESDAPAATQPASS